MTTKLYGGRDVEYHLVDGNLQVRGPRCTIELTPTDVNALLHCNETDGTEVTLSDGWAVVTTYPWCDLHGPDGYVFTRIDSIETAVKRI
jgi:hypothetical protein